MNIKKMKKSMLDEMFKAQEFLIQHIEVSKEIENFKIYDKIDKKFLTLVKKHRDYI